MKILVIDDIRTFDFSVYEEDVGVEYARTIDDAIVSLMARQKWDEVWFDYDMGGSFGELEIFNTVLPVVAWLGESIIYHGYKPQIKQIYIHTSNVAGENILYNTLTAWYPETNIVDPQPWLAPRSQWADM